MVICLDAYLKDICFLLTAFTLINSYNEVRKEGIELLIEQLLKIQKLETLVLSLM